MSGIVDGGADTDAFVLGGTGSASFDYTLFGTQYIHFETLTKEDLSTWTLTGPDSNAVLMPITVTGGTLAIDPVLSGLDVEVLVGGNLSGVGGVRNANIAGIFTPGGFDNAANFSVANDLTFQSASIFNVDIFGDGSSDVVAVGGTAALAGTLSINGVMFPAGFSPQNEYRVLTADGGFVGAFDNSIDNLPDVNAVVTVLPQTGPLDPVEPNRPETLVVSYQIAGDTSDKSIFANSVQAASRMGQMFGGTWMRRTRLLTCRTPIGRSGWTSGMGGFHGVGDSAAATGYDDGFGGFAAGVDQVFRESGVVIRTGLAGGYWGGSITSGMSSADLNGGFMGVYGSLCGGPWLVFRSASFGFMGSGIERGIGMGAGAIVPPQGDSDWGTVNLSMLATYNLAQGMASDGRALRFAPLVSLDYLNGYRNSYSESGSMLLDLDVGSAKLNAGLFGLGVEMGTQYVSVRGIGVQTLADVRWQHMFGDNQVDAGSSLMNFAGPGFVDSGALEARNRVDVGVGMSARFSDRVTLDGRYDASVAQRSFTHGASGGITIRR